MKKSWVDAWGSAVYTLYAEIGVGIGVTDARVSAALSPDLICLTWNKVVLPNATHVNVDVHID